MLLVLAHAGDESAAAFAAEHGAEEVVLVTPRALSQPGWTFRPDEPAAATFCVDGRRMRLAVARGVMPRLAEVTPADLPHVVAEDRVYVAAEMTAFLLALLAATAVPVINRPTPQCLCGPAWTDAKWRREAARLGLDASPARADVTYGVAPSPEPDGALVSVVGDRCLGTDHPPARERARAAGATLLTVAFDARGRVLRADPWIDLAAAGAGRAVLDLFAA